MRPSQALSAIAVAAAFALAGCNGDAEEKNDYVGQLNELTPTLTAELSKLQTELTAIGAPDQVAQKLSAFAGKVSSVADQIAAIAPPDEVADLQANLVEQIRTLGDEATDAADEVKQGGPAAVVGAGQQFAIDAARLGDQIDSTISEINAELQG